MHAAALAVLLATTTATPAAVSGLDALYPQLDALYLDLHKNPELSGKETKTAAKLAERLRSLGYQVTTGVGGTGVVGVLKNGTGPTVLVRTELDALPVEEKTGLPYASKATATDPSGKTVPVMHACGHDVHMTSWTGAATLLARTKDRWRGTVVMIAQPAEETVKGAKAMLADGLFSRFPKPDFAIAIHDKADLPAGKVTFVPGYMFANVDSVDVTLFGRGGHGGKPETTVDPIVMAARTVLALQQLVSREKDPLEPAVVTVGSIHGGFKHNIIPDQVHLQLTVRSYSPEVRKQLLDGVVRLGGSGGFALANLGVEGAGAGSIGSGIEVLSVATAQGLFAGGGIQGTKLWPGEGYNAAVYGAGSNLAAIANGHGGQVTSAGELRGELAKAVVEAWGR